MLLLDTLLLSPPLPMNLIKRIAYGVAGSLSVMAVPFASAQVTTGPALGATALTNSVTGATNVLNTITQTVGSNIQFFLVIAATGIGIWVVRFIMRKFTKIHR